MNKNPLISIIIPIYQVEKYLKDCLDTVIKQTFKDYELILVDDGSTDNSGKIIDEYALKDKRIITIHQTNQGLSQARNAGLNIAKGKYITFIDSDDILLSKYYLEYLYNSLINNNAQISMYPLTSIYEDTKPYEIDNPIKESIICKGKEVFYFKNRPKDFFIGCAFGKLYDHHLFKDVRYPCGRYVEDNAVIHYLLYPSKKVTILNQGLYGYRHRPSGIMGSVKKSIMLGDVIYAFEDRRRYFLAHNEKELAEITEYELLKHINLYR